MKRQSITPVFIFEDPNTPEEFECILKKILIERLLALYRQIRSKGEAPP